MGHEKFDLEEILAGIDPRKPHGRTQDGCNFWDIECRIWGSIPGGRATLQERIEPSGHVTEDDGKTMGEPKVGEEPEQVTHEMGQSIDPAQAMVSGIASSTSKDSHGTEMSYEALDGMRDQFMKGVPVVPSHGGFMDGPPEWDGVIGYTRDAKLEQAKVAAGHPNEIGYTLFTDAEVYPEMPKVQNLLARLERNQPIGQSIGGWFKRVRVVSNEEGEVERIIVEDVELDHLAITRMPSNPDARGLIAMRSKLDEIFSARDAVATEAAPSAPPVNIEVPTDEPVVEQAEVVADEEPKVEASSEADAEVVGEVAPPVESDEEEDETVEAAAEVHETAEVSAEAPVEEQVEAAAQPVDESAQVDESEPEEQEMSHEQSEAILAEIKALSARMDQFENRSAAPKADEKAELRAQLEKATARIQELEGEPVRRAVHSQSPVVETEHKLNGLNDLVVRTREAGEASTLTVVAEKHASVLENDKVGTISRSKLEAALRDIVVAGEQDGLIVDPASRGTWA